MADELTRMEVQRRVDELLDALVKETCRTCDCFQGYLVQMEIDAAADVEDITGPLRVPREKMHRALGCDPCLPGSHYADYMKSTRT